MYSGAYRRELGQDHVHPTRINSALTGWIIVDISWAPTPWAVSSRRVASNIVDNAVAYVIVIKTILIGN
jgi:hypothetical protein